MAEVTVTAEREYKVRITGDWRGDLSPWVSKRTRTAIVFSASMRDLIPNMEFNGVEVLELEIPDGEFGKSPAVLQHLWNKLGENGFTRSDLIVAIGGGTVTDISGFLAASWLRGVDWIAIPTTLAGMVDASVGGKTGINSPFGKNLIGAFHSPISVIIDPTWLKTLSDRDFAAGLAEVIKCGFIDQNRILELVEGRDLPSLRADGSCILQLIEQSVSTKANVVSLDFRESELREILNYGHTFGHAIEKVSNYSIRHGEAVSIGMVFVAELASAKGLITHDLVERHRQVLKGVGLPISLGAIDGANNWSALYSAMTLDKKSRGNSIRLVVLNEIGNCTRIEDASEEDLKSAYEKVLL
jgi:3-dehydroquinate synthase